MLAGFVDYIMTKRREDNHDKILAERTVMDHRQCVKTFCDYLTANDFLKIPYRAIFDVKHKRRVLTQNLLTESQIREVLSLPNEATCYGFRDKVLFETAYGTGIRRGEIIGLEIYDLNFEEKTIFIRQGKGKKDRVVPLGKYLERYLKEYLEKVRPFLLKNMVTNRLFLTRQGEPMSYYSIWKLMKKYSRRSGIKFSCHTFRHSFATHMLKHGAGLFYIQRILGHTDPATTQIYTHIYPVDLKRAVLAKHPRSNRKTAGSEIKLPIGNRNRNLKAALERLNQQSL